MWQKRAATPMFMDALLAGCGGGSAAGERTFRDGSLELALTDDFDGDGDEDLVIFQSAGVPLLFENTTRGAGDRGMTVSFGPENHPVNGVYTARYTDEIIGLGDRAGLVANLRVDWPNGKTITIEAPQPRERIELP